MREQLRSEFGLGPNYPETMDQLRLRWIAASRKSRPPVLSLETSSSRSARVCCCSEAVSSVPQPGEIWQQDPQGDGVMPPSEPSQTAEPYDPTMDTYLPADFERVVDVYGTRLILPPGFALRGAVVEVPWMIGEDGAVLQEGGAVQVFAIHRFVDGDEYSRSHVTWNYETGAIDNETVTAEDADAFAAFKVQVAQAYADWPDAVAE